MTRPKRAPKPPKPDLLPENLQKKPTLPQSRAKRAKVASSPTTTTPERSVILPEPTEEALDATFSPGHAPGYIQWTRASVPDVTNETEEEKKKRINKKHAPKGRRGTRCINDGKTDRRSAVLGTPDLTRLYVDFKFEGIDENTKEIIHGDIRYEYDYIKKGVEVDWNDPKFIEGVSNWRSQVIRRNIGRANDKKDFWTIQEQKVITGIITDYLDAGKDIDWSQIAREYNFLMRDTKQEKGAPGAPRRYCCRDKEKSKREAVSISMPLWENRYIPTRTDWILRREMGCFLDPDAIAVMERLRASMRPQLNGHPPKTPTKEEKLLIKRGKAKGKAIVQDYSEEEDETSDSSTYGIDRSLIGSPLELTPMSQVGSLTEPRPLLPRPVTIAMPVEEPPARRYKKRTAYSEEIVYDSPSTDLQSPISFNTIQSLGGSQRALDTLAEQAAIMYDQLTEKNQLIAPGPVAPTPIKLRQGPVVSGPSSSTSFDQKPESSASSPNEFASLPDIASRRSSPNTTKKIPSPTWPSQRTTANDAIMMPIWAIHRRMEDQAAAKTAAAAVSDAANADTNKATHSE